MVMIGKLMGAESLALATSQAEVAIDHMAPEIKPGSIALGNTWGRLRLAAQ